MQKATEQGQNEKWYENCPQVPLLVTYFCYIVKLNTNAYRIVTMLTSSSEKQALVYIGILQY